MADGTVLIVGAGPTGLVLALWLTKLGVPVRIIDKTAEPGTTSRALAVQARTLELYRQLDLAEPVVARGHKVPAVNLWVRGEAVAHVSLEALGAGQTAFAFLEIFPQDEHEELLVQRLEELGGLVERRTELAALRVQPDAVHTTIRLPDGREEDGRFSFVAGCDGAHSIVRRAIDGEFPGGTYRQLFYVADVEASGPPVNGELHIDLDEADFLAVFPLAGEGRARLIGTVRDERAEHPETLRFDDVAHRAIENLKVEVKAVHWFSTYRVHHRVAGQFRAGRAFLLGDAAHIHSPAGGQGMNTGIGDAINLAWKLAAVLAGRAPDTLLDSYGVERRAFAEKLVSTTDLVFTFATAEGRIADLVRTRLAPIVAPGVLSFESVRSLLFRTVSQLGLNYRTSPLSEGAAGGIYAGDRLPWTGRAGIDNFASLSQPVWQVHVYGEPPAGLEGQCEALGLPLHVFAWSERFEDCGLVRNAFYLLRPDTYVALAGAEGDPAQLARYFSNRDITPAGA
jgi:2-polyprenyl-6-methoxyphenol hydroxylase-like FAD-dependent oxidoreductase